jgi:molybdate transport system substrate-binding protein
VKRLLIALAATTVLAGCGSTAQPAPPGPSSGAASSSTGTPVGDVTVFAAASLTETFTQIGKDFEAAHPGSHVRFSFAGSSALAQQIKQGAPADVFASAAPANMKQVAETGSTVFVRNKLEIAVPKGNPKKIASLADLVKPGVKLALCAEQVPCGAASKKAFQAASLNPAPVTFEQDVKASLTKVRLGEVDAALVYKTDVSSSKGDVDGVGFPEADQAINDYPIIALPRAANSAGAKAFVAYVLAEGRAVLSKAGFDSP